jgi:hypothetical protein
MSTPPEELEVSDVLELCRRCGDSVLVVGNGLSQSYASERFDWARLRSAVFPADSPHFVHKAFQVAGTDDFEAVAKLLRDAASLLQDVDPSTSVRLREFEHALCRNLASAVLAQHPRGFDRPTEQQFRSCARFLGEFRRVVTVNYDLLVYWAVNAWPGGCRRDGFGECKPSTPDSVCWQGEGIAPCVEYLHGALHLYADALEVKKLRSREAKDLLPQISDRIKSGKFPLVVAGPTSAQKLALIDRSPYLRSVFRRLRESRGVVVTFGWSAGVTDAHVVDAIVECPAETICVGCHGLVGRIPPGELARLSTRLMKVGKRVVLFDTTSLDVWNGKY